MKKGKIIGLLAGISCVAVAAGAGMVTNAKASASQTIGGKDVSSFAMEYGAGVRIPTSDGKNGIRFTATLDDGVYADLEALENDTTKVNYGMMIVPANYVEENALTPENVFGVNGATQTYTFDACTAKEGEDCTCGVKHITRLTYEELTVGKVNEEATEDTAIIRGSLVNIHDDNRTREFVGMAYIEYDQNGTKTYAFANYADGKVENNTRSMTYVTQLHLNGGGTDDNDALYNRYVAPYMDYEHKYTIEHYFPNTQGEYGTTADKTETKWGTLNQTVYAKNIAKVTDVELTDEQRETYSTAVMNGSENACTSAPVYVNGNTVLKCYYKTVSNVLFDGSKDADIALLASANEETKQCTRTTQIEKVEDSEKGMVAQVSSVDNGLWGDGYLDMAFAEEKLQTATDGNWDYLKFSMRVTAEYADSGIYDLITEDAIAKEQTAINDVIENGVLHLSSNNICVATFAVNEWVDVIIPKAKLNSVTYKADGSVWSSVVTNKKKTGRFTKEVFDETFNGLYGENGSSDYIFNVGTFAAINLSLLKGLSSTATTTKNLHDVKITYYIDEITWGVDYKAPEITLTEQRLAASEGGQISYTPEYTVTDDILPAAMTAANGTVHNALVESTTAIYKANGDEVEATEGVYTLTQGESYTLEIKANDWSVTDIDGNTFIKRVPLNISVADATSWSFDENDPNEIALVTANDWVSPGTAGAVSVYNKTYLDSYKEKTGVLKVETSMNANGSNGGSDVYFNFAEVEIDSIIAAFNNSDNFTLNMTLLVETTTNNSNYPTFGVCLCGGGSTADYTHANKLVMTANGLAVAEKDENNVWNSQNDKMLVDTWYSISINKTLLTNAFGWTSDDIIRAQLNGTSKIFSLSDFTVKLTANDGTPVTYYFDEISYSA